MLSVCLLLVEQKHTVQCMGLPQSRWHEIHLYVLFETNGHGRRAASCTEAISFAAILASTGLEPNALNF